LRLTETLLPSSMIAGRRLLLIVARSLLQ